MKSAIDKIVASEANPNVASGVAVNGRTLPADFVIMGVGVAPATEFLKGSGIDIERDGGIKVDQYLRVKSGPDTQNVFAIGKTHSCQIRARIELRAFKAMSPSILNTAEMRRGLSIGMSLVTTVGQLGRLSLGRSNLS
jgi:NADPH-dependent 2,4-dienoyl-CoA reductase/sulfur reductase-like enzyme